ncbi:hypothetical protein E6Q11_04365 [Candidatus Dojkabacteria bacterium]|uniref:Uncharacterized protein n=1 Tax=Candidatus Dojkabacteria bacterium TaxID=2099670 RepID=A0A5C7J7U4_9BACT|nr:MAG: hypothetical protein E6Q11_04365 [Candidatus Dojkabacteria bacterium]
MNPQEIQNKENMTTLTERPEWVSVEEITKKQLAELLDIRNIETTQEDAWIAREVRARLLAVEKLSDFYSRYKFSSPKAKEEEVPFR